LPAIVFGDGARVRLVKGHAPSEPGSFVVMVPITEGDQVAGYVRMAMRSQRIEELYRRGSRNLLLVAIAGLIAVAAGGIFLHMELSRRTARLTRALEDALRDEPPSPGGEGDEFSAALGVARQLGRDLRSERGGRLQALQRMDALLKAVDVGVLIVEADGSLGFASTRAAELLGYSAPCELANAWTERWRDVVMRAASTPAAANGSNGAEHELPPTDGAGGLRLETYALGENGREGHLVVVRSIASLDALQRELGLAIQMRGLMRFYAAFAHDLKAPLNAMVMTLELLKMSVEDDPDIAAAARQKQLGYVRTLNHELLRLDRQLLTLLSHTAPPSEKRNDIDLCALLQELESLLGPQARRQRVALTLEVPDQTLAVVGWGDRLKQAMLNILINALEAMPEGGELRISLARQDEGACITVRDSGPGIPPELLGSIYQMHVSTKSGGTGVGLYVARSVVRAHGGQIDVRSAPGEGTSFILTLPLAA
ncbi:MAG: PAS domain-containing sensor histidine kinase, partial [Candidatus Binatia bacterium]